MKPRCLHPAALLTAFLALSLQALSLQRFSLRFTLADLFDCLAATASSKTINIHQVSVVFILGNVVRLQCNKAQ